MTHHIKQETVVITGVAALTPIGLGYQEMKRGLRSSEHRLGEISIFADIPEAKGLIGAELPNFDPKEILGDKGLRFMDRNTLIVLSCIGKDLAKNIENAGAGENVGLVVGTTFGSLASQINFNATYVREGFRALKAMDFPNMVINSPPSQGNIWFNLTQTSVTISNGFTAGLDAIIYAADMLKVGRGSCIVAGGADEFSLHTALAFQRSGLCSSKGHLRPFDKNRDGTLLGEGAAMFMLETKKDALQRGVPILAEILGYGTCYDGSSEFQFNTEADGATRAMKLALQDANINVSEVDFIAASANGSVQGDQMEATAIKNVFEKHATTIPVTAYKSYWGECYGSGGSMAVAAAMADLEDKTISKTCSVESDCCGLNLVTKPKQVSNPKVVMVNAFGYTGHNSSLILRK